MWGESVGLQNFDVSVWEGAAAVAERLWSNLGPSVTAAAAMGRYQALSCHWSIWGLGTYHRPVSHALPVETMDVPAMCPSAWSAVPGS